MPHSVVCFRDFSEPGESWNGGGKRNGVVDFICPACGCLLKVPEQYVGTSGTCNRCHARITISISRPPAMASGAPAARGSLPAFHPFRTTLVGVDAINADGTGRQRWIAQCRLGDRVALVRELGNRYDPSAVAVRCMTGEQIGYLSRKCAAETAPFLDAGCQARAEIVGLTGGTPGEPTRGVSIEVAADA